MSLFREKLQLDEDYKIMIQALVEEHGARGGQNDPDRVKVKDVVEDKGKGLVLLLHGKLVSTFRFTKANIVQVLLAWERL